MPLCKIADRIIQLNCRYGYTPRICADYAIEDGEPEVVISATDNEINELKERSEHKLPDGYFESLVIYKKLCADMPLCDGFLMHGSAIEFDSRAYLFTAKSGVGKTTHTMLWKQEFGDAVGIINGDKPILRRVGDGFRVYGTPWSGKEHYNTNTSAPLGAICVIERGDHNECMRLGEKDAVKAVMAQVMMPSDKSMMMLQLRLIDMLIKQVPVYKMICLPDAEAARVAFDTMIGNKL